MRTTRSLFLVLLVIAVVGRVHVNERVGEQTDVRTYCPRSR